MYFEGTIKHKVTTDSGKLKKVNSVYLIDAVSHADVETRLTELAEKTVQGDFTIKPIRVSEIVETIGEPIYDNWYKLKAQYELDKKITETYLVNASDIKSCIDLFLAHISEHTVDYEVPAVSITKIIDVLRYEPKGFDVVYEEGREWPEATTHHFPQLEERIPGDPNLLIDYGQVETFTATISDEDDTIIDCE